MTFLCPLLIAVALAQEPPSAQAPAKPDPVKADQATSHYTLGPQDLVKITVYVTDPRYREAVGEVRRRYIGDTLPASTLVVVAGLASPDYMLEIEGIAVVS